MTIAMRRFLERLLPKYDEIVQRLAGVLRTDLDTARDALHDVFVWLLGRWALPPALGRPAEWEPYLVTSALRRARRVAARRAKSPPGPPQRAITDQDLREESRRLREAMDGLPALQREVVRLAALGLSAAQIGVAMRKTSGAVRFLKHAALKNFRRLLGVAA